jgi:hypothetical protein
MDTSPHHDSPDIVHYHLPDDRMKHRTASFSFGAIVIFLVAASGVLGYKLSQQNTALANTRTQLERANSETAGVKADLTKANAKSADLQSQLDKAKQEQTNLQAEMKKNQEMGAGLQTQLDQTKADLKSQEEKAKSETDDLQAQLLKANNTSAGLRNELATARNQANDLKNQLATAKDTMAKQAPPAAAQTRVLPLTTDFKKSFFGSTFTLKISNSGTDALKLDIDISGSPKTPSKSATIEGGGTMELKDLAAGAKIAIASDGFAPISLTAQ